MEWIEANPLPQVCLNCQEEECYNCDFSLLRWHLSEEDEAACRQKMAERARQRLERLKHK